MPIRHFVHEHVHVALRNYGYGHYRKQAAYSPSVDDHGPCLTSFSNYLLEENIYSCIKLENTTFKNVDTSM